MLNPLRNDSSRVECQVFQVVRIARQTQDYARAPEYAISEAQLLLYFKKFL